jgi:antitoxin CptB
MNSPAADSRLRWQCRRGMRELDILLTNYLDNFFAEATEQQKQAFRELLTLPDPELIDYLLGGHTPQEQMLAKVVSQIRDRPQT